MLIRTQDRKRLKDTEDYYGFEINGNNLGLALEIRRHDKLSRKPTWKTLTETIGRFSTPEATLTELDRIHQWINDGAKGVYQVREEKVKDRVTVNWVGWPSEKK